MSYLFVAFLVGFVILVHEFGHYLAAKWVGIPIEIFSIGFGKAIYSFKDGETEYRLSIFPFGGYVLPKIETEEDFFNLPVYKRFIMTAGGPAASIILPIVCYSFQNVALKGFALMSTFIAPIERSITTMWMMLCSLPTIFSGSGNVSGIIGIVAQGETFIGNNPEQALGFVALLSLNLAVLNLLPIPALDGGKMVLYALERLHPKFLKLHIPMAIAGWILILGLTFYTTIIDIGNVFFA